MTTVTLSLSKGGCPTVDLGHDGLRDIRDCHSGLAGIFLRFTALLNMRTATEGFPPSGNDISSNTNTIERLENSIGQKRAGPYGPAWRERPLMHPQCSEEMQVISRKKIIIIGITD